MRVLYVTESLAPGEVGTVFVEMLAVLREHGVDPIVATLDGTDPDLELAPDVPVVPVSGGHRSELIRSLRGLLKEHRPDVIHTVGGAADMIGRRAGLGRGVPIVTSLVQDRASVEGPRWRHPFRGVIVRRLTYRFHALGHAVKESASRNRGIPEDAITVIPWGRDGRRLGHRSPGRRQSCRRRLDVPEGAFVVVVPAVGDARAADEDLLTSLGRLDLRRLVVVLIGAEGSREEELRATAERAGLEDHVQVIARPTNIGDVLAAADILVDPRGGSGAFSDVKAAMALELPVVAASHPSLREVVDPDRSALLVAVGDGQGFADAVDQLRRDAGLRARLGQRGAEIFHERYRIEVTVPRMVSFYRETRELYDAGH